MVSSEFKGRERIFAVDLDAKLVRSICLPCDVCRTGHYSLMALHGDLLVFRYTQVDVVPHIYCVRFLGTNKENIDELMLPCNMEVIFIEKAELGTSDFCK